jgi:DNA-binding NarL/FixJ family response regulator
MAEVVVAAFGGAPAGRRSEDIRVVLADRQPLVREGLALLLSSAPDITVVAAVDDGEAAVVACRALRPDVLVLEVNPTEAAAENQLHRSLRALNNTMTATQRPRVLALSSVDDQTLACSVLRAGAAGLVLKASASTELMLAIRRVAAGQSWLDPAVAGHLIAEFVARPEAAIRRPTRLASLTAREMDVLFLVAEGLSNQETAERLFISEGTVRTHLTRILAKLNLRSRTEAVVTAYRSGLVVLPLSGVAPRELR